MTLQEQIRQKFEEFEFDSDKVIGWIFEQKHSLLERKKKAFWNLTTFPEYGETKYIRRRHAR